jgi:hypothetical protein
VINVSNRTVQLWSTPTNMSLRIREKGSEELRGLEDASTWYSGHRVMTRRIVSLRPGESLDIVLKDRSIGHGKGRAVVECLFDERGKGDLLWSGELSAPTRAGISARN